MKTTRKRWLVRVAVTGLAVIHFLGCATPVDTAVRTRVHSFRTPDFVAEGRSLHVRAVEESDNSSLEFQFFKGKLEDRFRRAGFSISASADADYIALLSYGIEGEKHLVSTPVFGQTGGGASYTSGTITGSGGTAMYSGSTYSMPTYGVVGSASSTVTDYNRAIAIDVIDGPGAASGKIRKFFEMRARSTGICPVISEVFDEMLEAIFSDFPGQNNRFEVIAVEGEYNC